ncbi:GNAT family N-acetyltransferase [Phenylobacterium sp. LjRoot164]|uniref:GNAT family N-acetyltransferase n=1 Tax=unclassified Phenylobacterium TaxID=2640670 RepID=UPI003ED12368
MVISDLPQVEGAQVALISGSAVPELQELLERCADFEVLVTGSPPHADAAADLLVEVPPDHALRDKLVIGIWTEAGLTAAIDLLRDFPDPHAWYLGLLLIAPEARGQELGSKIVAALRDWIVAQGGWTIRLIVQEQNPAARRFWIRQGFVEIGTSVQELEDRTNQVTRLELRL